MEYGLGWLRHPPEIFWNMTLRELVAGIEGLVHSKGGETAADKAKVTLGGSANMNGRTRYCDAETLIVMNDEALAEQTRAVIEAQYERCTLVTSDMLGGFISGVRDFFGALVRKSA